MPNPLKIQTNYYQHFSADFSLPVPEEGFGGWKKTELDFAPDHTGVVVMHAWDCGTYEQYPGWHCAVPYIPRAADAAKRVFPALLDAVRKSPLPLMHVVSSAGYYKDRPGYQRAVELAGPAPQGPEHVASDPLRDQLSQFKQAHVFPGTANLADIDRGFSRLDFDPNAKPLDSEYICENGHQLFAVCKKFGLNHLIYAGFAIDGCLLISPGGMVDMNQRGMMCSAVRQAVVAIESKESASTEFAKELALWRVALLFGFVFDADDLTSALRNHGA
ncbi:MAG: hypothetical protein FJY92_03800 [Candidatus Hydrogenedentes bacterium]|nr:hypothetical protein [Candidatus Hydrogenedentota bacterium]